MKLVTIIATLIGFSSAAFGPTGQYYNWITVRPGAHMFFWIHKTAADVDDYTERPLVVWLQGGPGKSSTGHGNFLEIGPWDMDTNIRNTSWINDVNLLLLDSPVGTGFSYPDLPQHLANTNQQVAKDLVKLLIGFLEQMPELVPTPLYIFSEGYGAKMLAETTLLIDKAIKDGTLQARFEGIGLGSPWISPVDSVSSWNNYLRNIGTIDQNGYDLIQASIDELHIAINDEDWESASNLFNDTKDIVNSLTDNIDFYNVMTKIPETSGEDDLEKRLQDFMNGPVRTGLDVKYYWGFHHKEVFDHLRLEYMKPVRESVELILNTTDIKVAIYNGQLDLMTSTPGTIAWVDSLKFNQSDEWATASRRSLVSEGIIEGYVKKAGNLAMYWINRAGHKVPVDNPAAMRYILADITNNFYG